MTKEEAFNILAKHLGKDLYINQNIFSSQFYTFDRVNPKPEDIVSTGDTLLEAIENLPKEYRQ